ncbi:MAG: hypothetical protein RBS73_00060 [Prolixibacteraceae bacterium]|jgi:mannitol-1-phosphate 5-dehydrogenase|nr:hypothetical protein [Prolixibacteraceae bacterium]
MSCRLTTIDRNIVVFGAGKIGRSFVGQLFSRAGYHVVFVDIDQRVIGELNKRGKYQVVIKSEKDEVLEISNVSGILSTDTEAVVEAIAHCSLAATCVGKNALPKILPVVAKGIEKRFLLSPHTPLDIILAENVRDARTLVQNGLAALLGKGFPLDPYVGLIETSIGKMVPIMPKEIEETDPLLVYAEAYNILIVDKNGFKNPVPPVAGLAPKENIKAWVDRKAFVHNLGHATAAYFGHFKHPELNYLYEVLDDPEVYGFTREAMLQSSSVLQTLYSADYSMAELEEHIDDLLSRFQNRDLKDTVFRVGQDRPRKLGPDDRFVGMVRLAQKQRKPYDKILQAMAYAFFFRATDETGNRPVPDILFDRYLSRGLEFALQEVCKFDRVKDRRLILHLRNYYLMISGLPEVKLNDQ